jgi:hypothetical protein|tara:strand:- start:4074 stop:4532 length:459 start_codon:yes stop_codon:yes gene_type:complete
MKKKKQKSSKKVRSRKPSQATVLKLQREVEVKQAELRKKEKPFIRYSFHVESIEVDSNNLLEQIVFLYKGTMVIPNSLKEDYKPGSYSVVGTYIIPHDLDHLVRTRDFTQIKRKEIIKLLLDNVRPTYITGMKELIHKELMPEYKIITDHPW